MFSNLKGHPVKMAIHRRLNLEVGGYGVKLNGEREDKSVDIPCPPELSFSFRGLWSKIQVANAQPHRTRLLNGTDLLFDFRMSYMVWGKLQEPVEISVYMKGRPVGPPHVVQETEGFKLQPDSDVTLVGAIRINDVKPKA